MLLYNNPIRGGGFFSSSMQYMHAHIQPKIWLYVCCNCDILGLRFSFLLQKLATRDTEETAVICPALRPLPGRKFKWRESSVFHFVLRSRSLRLTSKQRLFSFSKNHTMLNIVTIIALSAHPKCVFPLKNKWDKHSLAFWERQSSFPPPERYVSSQPRPSKQQRRD